MPRTVVRAHRFAANLVSGMTVSDIEALLRVMAPHIWYAVLASPN